MRLTMEDALREAIRLAGSVGAIARACGVSPQAVSQWRTTPPQHVIAIAKAVGFQKAPHDLRPDLYPHPTDGLPSELKERAA